MFIIIVIKACLVQKEVGRTGQEFNHIYSYTVIEIKERSKYRIHNMFGILSEMQLWSPAFQGK